MLRTLDLFSGIGGFSLGLRMAGGYETAAFCEINPWCRRLLAKHWPGVPIYEDVRTLTAARLAADGVGPVDVICGGFPCQDISLAGAGAGLGGERSGLWREFARLIGEVRPRVALVENVGALRGRGLAAVLGDLAALGYDAQWHAISARAVGAPHLRDRVWIIASCADADRERCGVRGLAQHGEQQGAPGREPYGLGARGRRDGEDASHADGAGLRERGREGRDGARDPGPEFVPLGGGHNSPPADSDSSLLRLDEQRQAGRRVDLQDRGPAIARDDGQARDAADAPGERLEEWSRLLRRLARSLAAAQAPEPWTTEPAIRRVDDAIPPRLDRPRLEGLGNAVVPPIVEIIGRAVRECLT